MMRTIIVMMFLLLLTYILLSRYKAVGNYGTGLNNIVTTLGNRLLTISPAKSTTPTSVYHPSTASNVIDQSVSL